MEETLGDYGLLVCNRGTVLDLHFEENVKLSHVTT